MTELAELLAQVRRIEVRTQRMVASLASGAYRSAFRGSGLEFEEVREYTPGDDIRSIDWNVTARAGRPFVKVFREERELTIMLLVDSSGSMRYGAIPGISQRTKVALAAEAAAVVAVTALKNRDRIGLVRFQETTELHLPPRRGRGHTMRLVREVLAAPSRWGRTDLSHVLDELDLVAKRRCVCFLVSDFQFADPAQAALFHQRLQRTARRHDLIGLRVADPGEATLPGQGGWWSGPIPVQDPETGATRILTNSSSQRRAYAAGYAATRAATQAAFRAAGCDLVELSTQQSAVLAIQRFFLQRRRGHG